MAGDSKAWRGGGGGLLNSENVRMSNQSVPHTNPVGDDGGMPGEVDSVSFVESDLWFDWSEIWEAKSRPAVLPRC